MIPDIKWYQTKEQVMVSVYANNQKEFTEYDLKLDTTGKSLSFTFGHYNFSVVLLHPVKIKSSNYNGRMVNCVLDKSDNNLSWEVLTEDKLFNKTRVGIDWNNWKDLDDMESSVKESPHNGMDVDNLNEMIKQMGGGNVPFDTNSTMGET